MNKKERKPQGFSSFLRIFFTDKQGLGYSIATATAYFKWSFIPSWLALNPIFS